MFDPDAAYLRLSIVERIEPHAARAGVSEVARSPRGFLAAYKLASGEPAMMGRNPDTQKLWLDERRNFIKRQVQQAKKNREAFWTPEGQPTRRHLMLMIWAYTPTPERTAVWFRTLR